MHLIFITFISLFSFVSSSQNFWITTDIVNIEWKKDCLTTRECSRPRFEIAHDLKSADLRNLQSLPVSEKIAEDSSPFVSFWSTGSSEEISISASVIGVDPVYAFPRVCDSTTSTRPFFPGDISSRFRRVSISEGDVKTIQVFGRCFTATIAVKRHSERCPWCPEEVSIEEKVEPAKQLEGIEYKMIVSSLAVVVLVLLVSLIALAICLCCKKSVVRTPSPSGVFRPSKSPIHSMASSGVFSVSGSSIVSTVTITGSSIQSDDVSAKAESLTPSIDSGCNV